VRGKNRRVDAVHSCLIMQIGRDDVMHLIWVENTATTD
jgi:hypothetical protein